MKIVGNTVGTTIPKPDWNQTDPSKGDYIKNKPSATDGVDGVTFTPHMDEEGNLSWSNDGGRENPEPVNLTGPAGEPGAAGADGYTPVKGTDYYTEEDKEDIVGQVLESIPKVSKVTTDREATKTTMTLAMNNGGSSVVVINYDDKGEPSSITVDGEEVTLEFIYHTLYLYNKGDACESAHGGWVASTRMHSSNSTTPTLTMGATEMTAAITGTSKNFESGCVETASGFDLSNFSKVTFTVTGFSLSNSNGDALIHIGVTDDLEGTPEFDAFQKITGKGTYELDISALSGVHDFLIYLKTDEGSGNTAKVVISEIKVE
jgi:hypothetical protein